jgi:hypothetical protein
MLRPRLLVLALAATLAVGAMTALAGQRREAYNLYTHCGITWARIDGRWWRATRPLSDGAGNPPAGWGNPFQHGVLTFTGPGTARFDSAAGSVTFKRTPRVRPPLLCD